MGACQRVPDSLVEQRPIGEQGYRVVKGLMLELLFEGFPFADITAVEHDAVNNVVLEHIRVENLDLTDPSVAVAQRAVDHLTPGTGVGRSVSEHMQETTALTRDHQVAKRRPDDGLWGVTQ